MPVLKLRFKNSIIEEFPLNSGQTLTIGRSDSNDIVIDNMSVSGLHARIDSVSATFILTDLESTNGTFVNEELIATHTLRDNDIILIGKHELIFDRTDLDVSDSTEEETEDDKTMYLDTAQYRELINKNLGNTAPSASSSSQAVPEKKENFLIRLLKKFF